MSDFVTFGFVVLNSGLLVVAALHDAATRTIPNCIPALVAGSAIALRSFSGGLLPGLEIATFLLIITGLLWIFGFIGGGDMKLIPASSLLMQPYCVPDFIVTMTISGGGLALLYLALSRTVTRPHPGPRRGLIARIAKAEAWRMSRRGPLPYAVAIAFGAIPGVVKNVTG